MHGLGFSVFILVFNAFPLEMVLALGIKKEIYGFLFFFNNVVLIICCINPSFIFFSVKRKCTIINEKSHNTFKISADTY